MPVVPAPSSWSFDLDRAEPGEDLIGLGADLEPGTILDAYATGVFPMGVGRHGRPPMGWWSPDPRGILRLPDLSVSRSLRKSLRQFEIRVDTDFAGVVAGCADPGRTGRWITPAVSDAYTRLHALGWAHSVEVVQEGRLVGGLYGLAIGGLFAGESMFHRATDASKAALVGLVDVLRADGDPRRFVDVQWRTDHLATLGISQVPREDYRRLLGEALTAPLPQRWR